MIDLNAGFEIKTGGGAINRDRLKQGSISSGDRKDIRAESIIGSR